jgi:hypothetical protein
MSMTSSGMESQGLLWHWMVSEQERVDVYLGQRRGGRGLHGVEKGDGAL